MIARWMAYSEILAVAAGLIAFGLVRLLDRLHDPRVRWVWPIASWVRLLVPLALLAAPALSGAVRQGLARGTESPGAGSIRFAFVTLAAVRPTWLGTLDRLVLVAWCAGSMFTLTWIIGSVWRLRRFVRKMPGRWLRGVRICKSEIGPAAGNVGLPIIFLPPLLDQLSARTQECARKHELEHLRANDSLVVWHLLAVIVLLPWSPTAWLALLLGRHAVEIGCDDRIIRRVRSSLDYATALVDIAAWRRERTSLAWLTVVSDHEVLLQRRVRRLLTEPRANCRYVWHAAVATSIGLAIGCGVSRPRAIMLEVAPSRRESADSTSAIMRRIAARGLDWLRSSRDHAAPVESSLIIVLGVRDSVIDAASGAGLLPRDELLQRHPDLERQTSMMEIHDFSAGDLTPGRLRVVFWRIRAPGVD
jgi:beta-lactamase regulating signal transducer with metallopeptidase domain